MSDMTEAHRGPKLGGRWLGLWTPPVWFGNCLRKCGMWDDGDNSYFGTLASMARLCWRLCDQSDLVLLALSYRSCPKSEKPHFSKMREMGQQRRARQRPVTGGYCGLIATVLGLPV